MYEELFIDASTVAQAVSSLVDDYLILNEADKQNVFTYPFYLSADLRYLIGNCSLLIGFVFIHLLKYSVAVYSYISNVIFKYINNKFG